MRNMWIGAGLLACAALATEARGAEYYVAPDGKATNPGTREAPWDIVSALGGKQKVQAGDTIWLTGGTYRNEDRTSGSKAWLVRLPGTKDKPIHVRVVPGQRATVDGGLQVSSTGLWLWDLEIMVSEYQTLPRETKTRGSHPGDLGRPGGSLNIVGGADCKFINLVIHDNSQGVGFWKGCTDSEIHGCLIYNNGWTAPDRWHGPGIYTQNMAPSTKWITDNIVFGNYSNPLQAYGSKAAFVENFHVEGNFVFGPTKGGRNSWLVGGERASKGIVVKDNVLHGCPIRVGYGPKDNEDCVVEGNTVVRAGLSISGYSKVTEKDNTVVQKVDGAGKKPTVFLRPNKYDESRANLAVINWAREKSVVVDLAPFLRKGDRFRVQNATDFFGAPVLAGTYEGAPVALTIPASETTGQGEFGAFVVLKERRPASEAAK